MRLPAGVCAIIAILTKLGQRGVAVREAPAAEYATGIDADPDTDGDREQTGPNPPVFADDQK